MKVIIPILLSLAPTAAAQTVWTVGPAAPHTEISSAVEAAQDGDLIRNGGGAFLFGSEGSPGMLAADSFLTLRSSDIHSGRGGNPEDNGINGCGTPGNGGAAIRAWSTTVVSQSNQLTGGKGGRVFEFNCNLTGAPGLPFAGHGAQLTELPGTAPRLSAPSLVREGDPVQFTFEGDPGSRVDLIVGLGDAFLYLPALSGNLLVAPPFLRDRFIAGVIPASGTLDWTLNAPGVPALTWAGLRFQSGHYDPVTSSIKLGPVHVLAIADSAW